MQLDLEFFAQTDLGLVKLRAKCARKAAKYKRADIVNHYLAIVARIDAFNGRVA